MNRHDASSASANEYPTHGSWRAMYAILLLVLVPLAIVLNALFIIDRFRSTADAGLRRTAMLAARMADVAVVDALGDDAALRSRLADIAAAVPETRALDIVALGEDGAFAVVATLHEPTVGMSAHGAKYALAWEEGRAITTRTTAVRAAADAAPITEAERRSGERYWNVVLPLSGADTAQPTLLVATFAFADVDALVRESAFRSIVWLIVTALAATVALSSATRVFRYADLQRKLREADRMKDDFISVASHELRAPITAIRGYLSLFLEDAFGRFDERPRKALETTFAISTHLGELVEDIIDVSRIEQGRLTPTLAATDPTAIIEEVVARFRFDAEKKGVALTFERPGDALPMVVADASLLKQALTNLCSNAIKYTPKGSVTITAERVDGGRLAIRITDTGIGMSAAEQERLFKKFERIKTDRTAGIPGTGLGLWITSRIVRLMRGSVTIDSIDRVGTQATILLPIAK